MTFQTYLHWDCMRKAAIACVVALGLLTQSTSLLASPLQEDDEQEVEEEPMVADGIIAINGVLGAGGQMRSKKFMQAVKKLDVILQLQMQVDELKEVCGIDDNQAKKLNIAAKAAAQKQMEKWSKTMDEFQMWDSMGADKEDEKNIRVDEIDLSKVDPDVLQWMSTDFTGEMRTGPSNEKVWKKALKSALTDEQREKLEAHRQKKQEKMLETTVQFFSQMYGNQLLLNDEQETAFAEAIRKRLSNQDAPLSVDETYNTMMLVATIRPKELEKFMTEKQLDRWRILTGPYNNIGMFQAEIIEEEVEDEDDDETNEGDDG